MKTNAKTRKRALGLSLLIIVYMLTLKFITIYFIAIYLLIIAGIVGFIYHRQKKEMNIDKFAISWVWTWGWLCLAYFGFNLIYTDFGEPFINICEIKSYSTHKGKSEVLFVFNDKTNTTQIKRRRFESPGEKETFVNSHSLELTLVKGFGCYYIKQKRIIKKE